MSEFQNPHGDGSPDDEGQSETHCTEQRSVTGRVEEASEVQFQTDREEEIDESRVPQQDDCVTAGQNLQSVRPEHCPGEDDADDTREASTLDENRCDQKRSQRECQHRDWQLERKRW